VERQEPETPLSASEAGPPRARILIVDDDERNAFAAVQALEPLDHELVVARSGQEALRRLLDHDYAVVLLDLHMPGMDGYETAELIRSRKRNRNTPIVFLTAVFRDEAHLFQAYSAGAIDVVFKPVDPFILRSKVAVLVDLHLKTLEIQEQAAQRQQLLEENARVRTEKMKAERQLAQAQKMEAVGQLTGGVAHDFNNLLTVVLGNVDMLLRKADKEPRRLRQLNAIRQAAERGRSLTRQLLAFSRRQQLSPLTVEVQALIANFLPLMQQAVGESVQVRFTPIDDELCVHVDPAQLESALLNLAVNARDAMPAGGSFTISCRREDLPREVRRRRTRLQAGSWVVIEAHDTGTGMSQEVLDRVFEPFFTTKDVGHGSGLGLSQVYGFVNQSGGHIEVESAPGAGAVFRLHLRRSEETAVVRPTGDAPSVIPKGRSERILVVEDDPQVLSLTVEMLGELRYDVVTAPDAPTALDILRNGDRVDVIFSDVVMPGGVNGVQLAREAKALRPDTRILLTSGYVGTAEEVASEFQLLSKPYDRAVLATKLRELCDEDKPAGRPKPESKEALTAPS
jgi:signal transduction histidine kinase